MKRERKRLQVNFEAKGIKGVGFTENVSSDGMNLHSKFTTAPGNLVSGQISFPDGAKLDFQAEIRWVNKPIGPLAQLVQGSMGLRFTVQPRESDLSALASTPQPSRPTKGP
jgi:hypothetical protein